MRFLLLNQTFYPDVVATGQHLAEVAAQLAERGHQVTVVTSDHAYDSPEKRFPKQELWRGVRILRVGSTGFGKTAKWRRAADFASFLVACSFRLAFLRRHDAVVALTTPPLISFLGAWLARLWRASFFYWVMDLNPDEAIAAGWLRPGSLPARVLDGMSRFSLRRASKVIALDRFMQHRLLAKGIPQGKIAVISPWSQDDWVRFDAPGRERFLKTHGLQGKFVVMYSGNHSPVHPMETLLQAAEKLKGEKDIVFCFVGGGSEWRKIKEKYGAGPSPAGPGARHPSPPPERVGEPTLPGSHNSQLPNILCLPYQPLEELSGSLSAADLHVVVMGDAMLGLVHPCKIYNILGVGAPVLYIGPQPSHVTELFEASPLPPATTRWFASLRHGDVDGVVREVLSIRAAARQAPPDRAALKQTVQPFNKEILLGKLLSELEKA